MGRVMRGVRDEFSTLVGWLKRDEKVMGLCTTLYFRQFTYHLFHLQHIMSYLYL